MPDFPILIMIITILRQEYYLELAKAQPTSAFLLSDDGNLEYALLQSTFICNGLGIAVTFEEVDL